VGCVGGFDCPVVMERTETDDAPTIGMTLMMTVE
jgi:hypothetical protein